MAKTVNKLKQADVIALADFLRKVAKSENGVCIYDDGYNDQKVAHELSCTVNNVAGMRRAILGDLPKVVGGNDIIRRLEALEAWAAARPVQPFKR